MKRTLRLQRAVLAALALVPAAAFAASGEVSFFTGEVTIAKRDGRTIPARRGEPVDAGDRITTGPNGMVQLTMVDNARISLRPGTQFVIEQYADRRDSTDGAVLSLLKGTLRTFTGLIAANNRDRFVMKTRVATVGIRGSGNILYACEGADCDPSVLGEAKGEGAIAVNHTIEGSHAVSNLPAQGGAPAGTLVTGPGQTVLVSATQPPRYIPTPRIIADAATNMTNSKGGDSAAPGSADTRNFSPSDTLALPANLRVVAPLVGNNGLGFPTIDATANLANDPLDLRDVVLVAGAPISGQSLGRELVTSNGVLLGYNAYGAGGSFQPALAGDVAQREDIVIGGAAIVLGRTTNARLGFQGQGTGGTVPGSVHWIYGPSGYPMFLSDVLTGTATYTLAASTSPTNQNNTTGTLAAARIDANFTSRTLGFAANVTIPGAGGNPGGSWQLTATDVPIALNAFFATTNDRLTIVNQLGISSRTNSGLSGGFEGSFVGTGLAAAILGYNISDATATNPLSWNFVNGVAALQGPRQNAALPYREGRISDASGELSGLILTYAATNRPEEVVTDGQNRATQFVAPRLSLGGMATYSLGGAQVVQSGVDPETGMIWGRWAGGIAQASRNGQTDTVDLRQASLHYIFAGPQSGPVTLPLTGTGVYDVIGSTSPTDFNGRVGTLNTATLNANFSTRTADASVNIGINGQTWTGTANGMPIYRDQYFSAYTGQLPGLPNPGQLQITCTPSCGTGATGSFDGFFTGRTGQRAGLMYRLGPNQGAVAFGRR